jgi:hypothetical protein
VFVRVQEHPSRSSGMPEGTLPRRAPRPDTPRSASANPARSTASCAGEHAADVDRQAPVMGRALNSDQIVGASAGSCRADPKLSYLDIGHRHRSPPGRHGRAAVNFRQPFVLWKVSGANELGGAKRGANVHRHQATPGHVQPQAWLADATPGHVQPRPATVRTRLTSEGPQVRTLLRPLFSQLRAVLRSLRSWHGR